MFLVGPCITMFRALRSAQDTLDPEMASRPPRPGQPPSVVIMGSEAPKVLTAYVPRRAVDHPAHQLARVSLLPRVLLFITLQFPLRGDQAAGVPTRPYTTDRRGRSCFRLDFSRLPHRSCRLWGRHVRISWHGTLPTSEQTSDDVDDVSDMPQALNQSVGLFNSLGRMQYNFYQLGLGLHTTKHV